MLPRRRWLWLLALGAVLVLGARDGWWYDRLEQSPLSLRQGPDGASPDLAADLKAMWETEPLVSDGPGAASTERAVRAASRVFDTVSLVGKARAEVIALLGDPKKAGACQPHPHYAPANSLVYCFDSGPRGWQFNVLFGWAGKVIRVDRFPLH